MILQSTALCLLLVAPAFGSESVYQFLNLTSVEASKLVQSPCASCWAEGGSDLVDVWKGGEHPSSFPNGSTGHNLVIRGGEELLSLARSLNIQPELVMANYSELVSRHKPEQECSEGDLLNREFFTNYRSLCDQIEFAGQLDKKYSFVTRHNSPLDTWGDRAIRYLTVGDTSLDKYVYLQCGLHAREWITTPVCLWVAHQAAIAISERMEPWYSLSKKVFFVIGYQQNPDGYVYSWRVERLWRKNRRQNNDQKGSRGVDLNRNFETRRWGEVGVSQDPSSDIYPGTSPFSEPESRAVKILIEDLESKGKNLIGAIDFHSYGEMWLVPYGFTYNHNGPCEDNKAENPCRPPNDKIGRGIGQAVTKKIKEVHGKTYRIGTPAELLSYAASGGADDFFYNKASTKIASTPELRPSDAGVGFVLPPDQIIPTVEEMLPGVIEFTELVLEL